MKKIYCLILVLLAISCSSKSEEDPLILPPNFAEMPDLKNPEQPSKQQKEEDIARLKELLLKSDEQ
jgi:hypothetical protein